MAKIRVLVVDDAVVVRKIVTDVLSADPDIEVIGTAPNGKIALSKIDQLKPDLVTLDVEMPEMDGLAALKALRISHPILPVIMFSTLTERGAATTIDALMLGANDYVTKPANVGSVMAAMAQVREQLIPKVKALCGRSPAVQTQRRLPTRAPILGVANRPSARPGRIDVVAIGVSTGGPNALAEVFRSLPANLPVPIVVVQHMPPNFTRLLAERLDSRSPLRVAEARSGQPMEPGLAWVAPGDNHLVVRRSGTSVQVMTNKGPAENSCRPAVDPLFRSVVDVYGPNVLGVVMTGMGHDGLQGCELIHNAGGQVIIQDEASSVVWGMPGAVAHAGLADKILPLSRISAEIIARSQVGRAMVGQR